jgi:hypothetical protein
MTDKEFIKFSKEYFGDLDYTKLSEAEYKQIYEAKESERIISMATEGKLDQVFIGKLSLRVVGTVPVLFYNNKPLP